MAVIMKCLSEEVSMAVKSHHTASRHRQAETG